MTRPHSDEELWLWWDTEATDLLECEPVALEVGWMITTPDLRQRRPLRNRYVYLDVRGPLPNGTVPEWPADRMGGWASATHRDTGLEADWTRVRDTSGVICSVAELDALVGDDVAAARAVTGYRTLRLAGAGVVHYDHPLLRTLGSQIPSWCQYGTADTTRAAIISRIPKVVEPDADDGLKFNAASAAGCNPHRVIADIRAAWATARSIQARVQMEVSAP